METDVLIAGGGPAGLSAAIAARQQGLRVLVADVAKPPIDKACGEGLMPDSLQALAKLGITLKGVDTGEFRGIRFVGPSDSVEALFPNGEGRGIRRTLLHEALIKRANEAGAELLWKTRVQARMGEITLDDQPVRYKWLIGADGHESRIREFARLDAGAAYERRIGLRRHFRVKPWSDKVEIYWGENCQVYVTPIARDQMCVAVIARERPHSFEAAVAKFPALCQHLEGAEVISTVKGALTVSRRLPAVTSGRVALIGEASGSADAITGEGLAMCFRQAVALGNALSQASLWLYEREHRRIMNLPQFMGRAMLLMDRNGWIRRRSLAALSASPKIFDRMLSVHVGAVPPASFGLDTAIRFGWGILTAKENSCPLA
ncbi:MAG: NAD(P)/FAD-dependent oxidoreductase [Terriglobales bacterium]